MLFVGVGRLIFYTDDAKLSIAISSKNQGKLRKISMFYNFEKLSAC
jgi:hypothetical protein